jgi:VCBS repeat-containing protein
MAAYQHTLTIGDGEYGALRINAEGETLHCYPATRRDPAFQSLKRRQQMRLASVQLHIKDCEQRGGALG